MKRILSIVLCLLMVAGVTLSDSPATPTDLYETFEDNDFGYIENIERQVFLDFLHQPSGYFGEEITLIAILVNFKSDDIYTFDWEYSEDGEEWYILYNEHNQSYTYVINQENYAYWWRVKVIVQE